MDFQLVSRSILVFKHLDCLVSRHLSSLYTNGSRSGESWCKVASDIYLSHWVAAYRTRRPPGEPSSCQLRESAADNISAENKEDRKHVCGMGPLGKELSKRHPWIGGLTGKEDLGERRHGEYEQSPHKYKKLQYKIAFVL
jgi:hypothetical protein